MQNYLKSMWAYLFTDDFSSFRQTLYGLSVTHKVLRSQTSPGLFSHSTSMGRDWNKLHKTPTGQINLFLFLRLPSQTLIQMHAATLRFNNYPDSYRAVLPLVLFPLNYVSLVFACAVCQSCTWCLVFFSCNLPSHYLLWFFSVLLCCVVFLPRIRSLWIIPLKRSYYAPALLWLHPPH